MDSGLKGKFWGMGAVILLAVYALIPTFFPSHLSFLPEKGLNLGLDLRGGIYIELDVQVQEGLVTKLDILAQDLVRDLKSRNIEPVQWTRDDKALFVTFTFNNEADLQNAVGVAAKNYKGALTKGPVTPGNKPSIRFLLTPEYEKQIRKDIVSQAVQAVRNRVDRYGLAEPTVQKMGENRIVVELPGVKDPERAIKIIQQAGKLEFKLVNGKANKTELGNWIAEAKKQKNLTIGYSAEDIQKLNEALKPKLPEGTEVAFEITRDPSNGEVTQAVPYLLDKTAYVTGDMLKTAQVQIDPQSSEPYVSLAFNPIGAKNFGDLTKAHVKELLAIMLDGNVASAPQIREPILNGQCKIELGGNLDRDAQLKEAKDLTFVLQEGALPARLKEATKTVIGPTLGEDSINRSLKAIYVGTILVILFMVLYYKWSGLLADFAVILNTLFLFALLAMFQATLTLPGMAGIALTIGMAVDANILIFERIREELAAGQQPRAAVGAGYSNALRAIIDSNLTTIISGIILYQYGTGPIRGFAVTLMIGLVCNIFTAVMMTRTVYDYFLTVRKVQKISI